MIVNIKVNNQEIIARKGDTILSVLKQNGITIPTLCFMYDLDPVGACRICVVEIEGKQLLVPACSHPVEEWMSIYTHSEKVIKARKSIVELLLANHPDDCLYCEKNSKCELQKLASELNIRDRKYPTRNIINKIDKTSIAIVKEKNKCILCGRCVRVCEEIVGVAAFDFAFKGNVSSVSTPFDKTMSISNCVYCGQCTMVCPTGALYEKSHIDIVNNALKNPKIYNVAQFSPTLTLAIMQQFGIKNFNDANSVIINTLKKIGFKKVFNTSLGNDILTELISKEVIEQLESKKTLFSSCCSSWVKYAEQNTNIDINDLVPFKSSNRILGSLIKRYFSKQNNIVPENIFNVYIAPCPAKKNEIIQDDNNSLIKDTDAVLTLREFIKLVNLYGIEMKISEHYYFDIPFDSNSSSSLIQQIGGGIAEAVAKNVYYKYTGNELKKINIGKDKNFKHIKQFSILIQNEEIRFASVSSFIHLEKLLSDIKQNGHHINFIEVMACTEGCINGGGNPIIRENIDIKSKALIDFEEKEKLKLPSKNPSLISLNENFIDLLNKEERESIFHNSFLNKNNL